MTITKAEARLLLVDFLDKTRGGPGLYSNIDFYLDEAIRTDSPNVPQPTPTGDGDIVLFHVQHDLLERAAFGHQKYGTFLRTNNERDALKDAYQEALDLVMYLRQAILEQEKEEMDANTIPLT